MLFGIHMKTEMKLNYKILGKKHWRAVDINIVRNVTRSRDWCYFFINTLIYLRKASGMRPFLDIWKHTTLCNKGVFSLSRYFLASLLTNGAQIFTGVLCCTYYVGIRYVVHIMLGYTKCGHWSLAIAKVYPAFNIGTQYK